MAGNEEAVTRAEIEGLKVYINDQVVELGKKIDGVKEELKGEMNALKTEIRVNAVRIEEIKTSMNWHFSTLTTVVAIVGFLIAIVPILRDKSKDKKQNVTEDDVRRIFHEELAKLKLGA